MTITLNQQILTDLQNYDEDFIFLNKSINMLRKKYANRYVVIWRKEVVSDADTMNDAIELAKQKGVPAEKAIIEFIPKREEVLIL